MPNNPDKKSDKSKKPNKPDKKSAKKPMSDKAKKQPDLIEYDRFPLMKKPTFIRKDIYTGADIPIFI